MTDKMIYAGLADAVYGEKNEDSIPPGWTQIEYDGKNKYYEEKDLFGNPLGFAAAAYGLDENGDNIPDGNEIIISFRGTNDALDWLNGNSGILLDKVMEQYNQAYIFTEIIRQQYVDAKISFTGHSLGGALAQLMGAYAETHPINIVYGETYAFNAPGVSHLLDNLNITQTAFGTIHNYVNMSDLVGNLFNIFTIGNHIGSKEYLPPTPQFNDLFRAHGIYTTDSISKPIEWSALDGISLWWYDVNNSTSDIIKSTTIAVLGPVLGVAISSSISPSELNFKTAIDKVLQLGTPNETLHYRISSGDFIIDDALDTNPLTGSTKDDTIYGNEGDDLINGIDGLNRLYGGDGNDTIEGGLGKDTIYGGNNDDLIKGNDDNDIIYGDKGADTIYGGSGSDYIYSYDEQVQTAAETIGNKIYGEDGNDTIVATGSLNFIEGNDNEDTIQYYQGDNNIISGGSGNDYITLYSGNNNIIFGDDNNDEIKVNFGTNTLDGGTGNDTIRGGINNDIIIGGEGRDVLKGGDGDDTYKLSIGDTGSTYLINYFLGGEAIVDSDGWGEIIYDDNKITGGTIKRLSHKKNDSRKMYDYVASDGNTYKWHGIDGQSLEITTKNKDKIWIPKFNNGDLDINLNIEKVYFEDIGDAGVKAIQDKQKVSKFKSPTYGSTLYGDIGSDTISGGSGSDTITIDSGVGPDPTVPSTPDPTDREINTDQINNNIKDQWEPAKTTVSPLVIDLNGDGINTLGFTAGVYFDLDANGFAESCGWIDTNDGFLALDRNENGKIDDGRELFGDQTLLQNNTLAHGGFEALADLDSNQDGVINEADDEFENLKVWQDSNVNGLSSEDELHSLSECGIMIHFKYG